MECDPVGAAEVEGAAGQAGFEGFLEGLRIGAVTLDALVLQKDMWQKDTPLVKKPPELWI